MNIALYIARRYVISKKSTNVINIISGISAVGIAVAAAALVIVLSVFNGFKDLVASMQTNFDPQLKIEAVHGKTMTADDPKLNEVRKLPEIAVTSECAEDMVMMMFNGHQMMMTLKGVDDSFAELTHVKDCIYGEGDFCLHAGALEYAVVGARAAQMMGCDMAWNDYIHVYAAERVGQVDMTSPESAFTEDSLLLPPYVFSVGQPRYDKGTILAPIAFARRLLGMQGELTSLGLRMKEGVDISATKKKITAILGDKYRVQDRFEQQADTYKIMEIEKAIAFIFLTFILIVACFNIIGSISMLMIDKRDDVQTLRNLGATKAQISKIFIYEGRIITALGAVAGIGLGLLLCLAQQQFGFIKMGGDGSYIIPSYPVSVHYTDVLIVLITVIAVGWVSVWYPVHSMSKKIIKDI